MCSQVSDDAVEENVGTLRRTVSGLEAELKRARDELECYLEIPASMRGEPTGTETKVTSKLIIGPEGQIDQGMSVG